MKVTLGGNRLGSGEKMKIETTEYGRSSHDLSNAWRSTMSPGTLVPFMVHQTLPGDSWEIELNAMVLTPPANGALLGSFKLQLDVFQIPMRLYNSWIHNNKLGIGTQMQNVKIPQLTVSYAHQDNEINKENPTGYPINNSHILKYLGISGGAWLRGDETDWGERKFNAIPLIGYWDIFKNYYANKQEKNAYVITTDITTINYEISEIWLQRMSFTTGVTYINVTVTGGADLSSQYTDGSIVIQILPNDNQTNYQNWDIPNILKNNKLKNKDNQEIGTFQDIAKGTFKQATTTSGTWATNNVSWYNVIERGGIYYIQLTFIPNGIYNINNWYTTPQTTTSKPIVEPFELKEIDTIREVILETAGNVEININNIYGGRSIETLNLVQKSLGLCDHNNMAIHNNVRDLWQTQSGLLVKTYQNDIFNNYLNSEAIENGSSGINDVTKISTSSGSFSIDSLQLAYKVYKMLNDIQASGNTFDDWQKAVYNHERFASPEIPTYEGGLSKEIVFNELVSTAETAQAGTTKPLGTLASRGMLNNKHKGGKLRIKCNEAGYIMGIVSITPRIDYSQGNDWHTNLKTWNDLHKPALDQIGFQDLLTEQQAWFGTEQIVAGDNELQFSATGKLPAWTNYMTNYNRTFGHFAEENNLMFMTLNRRYEQADKTGTAYIEPIRDNTTYIDPTKFNYIFADTSIDAQNFWVQIAQKTTARRVMSAKVMPRL